MPPIQHLKHTKPQRGDNRIGRILLLVLLLLVVMISPVQNNPINTITSHTITITQTQDQTRNKPPPTSTSNTMHNAQKEI
jgi:hypothetical protein